MNSHDAHQRLEAALDREIEVARHLAATLDAERVALTGPAADVLAQHAEDKIAALKSLETLDGERQTLCDAAAIRLPPPARKTPAKTPAALALSESDALPQPLAARWQSLMEIVAQCRKANDVNGYIVNVRQRQVRQLIDIVRGGDVGTYGPEGKTFARALRALARA
jgi:flagellar biosynthesis/type III secretory pathway chaperone